MAYLALYRKWRPMVFEDVVEQEHVVKTLRNSITSGRIAHAYLFCGTRGTGKTSMAKIFSRAVNCPESNNGDPCNNCEICRGILSGSILDVVEIDAASNNSVDNVRDIRDEVIYTPSKAKYRVYIIDEVHMLSTGAFNALLKTLEEPPAHVIFILATTEPHKLPATILSRCQRYDFRRIPADSIAARVEYIAQESGIHMQEGASKLIARLSDGALRDAISILDQCMSLGNKELSYDDVLSVVGIVKDNFISDVVDAINNNDIDRILSLIDRLVMDGKNISQFVSDIVLYYRNLLICSAANNPQEIIEASMESINRMSEQCKKLTKHGIMNCINELSSIEGALKWSNHPRILLEMVLIKLCEGSFNTDNPEMVGRLEAVEKKIENIMINGATSINSNKAGDLKGNVNQNCTTAVKGNKSEEGKDTNINKFAGISAGDIKGLEVWEDVIKDLKKNGRMVLYSNLLETRVIEMGEKVVGIVFKCGSSFNKVYVSKAENLEVVQEYLGRRMGKEIRIKCLNEDDMIDNSKTEDKDDLTKKAQDFASKLNIELDIIDE